SEPEVQGVLRVSESGSHVYFVAGGKLTGPNPQGNEPVAGNTNLYVFERDGRFPAGHLAFIGALSGADRRDWDEGDGSRPAEATPDGRYLVFVSAAPLTPDDASTVGQVFEYDAKTEALVRLSVGQRSSRYPGGYNENGNSQEEPDAVTIVRPYFGNADVPTMAAGTLTVSNDGHYVFFQTPLALTPQASNNRVVGHVCFFESEGVCLLANTGYAQNVY